MAKNCPPGVVCLDKELSLTIIVIVLLSIVLTPFIRDNLIPYLGNINIGEYLLGRHSDKENAFSVIKVDEPVKKELLDQLIEVDEIINIKQISL